MLDKQDVISAAHTPGEWSHDEGAIKAADGEVIGYVYQMQGEPISVMRANARLIAAAPDLLASLRAALRVMNNECDPDEYAIPFATIRAAIAKATGIAAA